MGHFCCGNNHDLYNQLEEEIFTEEEKKEYALMVFLGIITINNPSQTYNFRVVSIFEKALIEGFGASLNDLTFGSAEYQLFKSYRESLLTFTEAKQIQQLREMFKIAELEREGFIAEGVDVFNRFNGSYLQAEYETTINTARAGRQWAKFEQQKSTKPMLTYKTQEDSRVRIEHRVLNNITRPINDPFWDLYYPPNGWNCRCFVANSRTAVPSTNIPIDEINREIPDLFKFNPGKTGYVFSPSHPYYKGTLERIREFV